MLLQVYGDNTMSHTRFFGHKRFKEVHEEVKEDFRRRRPSVSRTYDNVKHERQVVYGNHQLTVQLSWTCKERCLDDYHKRFGHEESLRKNGAKTTE